MIEEVKTEELNSSNVLYDNMFVHDTDKIAGSPAPGLPEVTFHDENQGTFAIAHWLMELVNWFLGLFHAEHDATLFTFVYAVVVFGVSCGVGYILKWIILGIVKVIGPRLKGKGYDALTEEHFFTKHFDGLVSSFLYARKPRSHRLIIFFF